MGACCSTQRHNSLSRYQSQPGQELQEAPNPAGQWVSPFAAPKQQAARPPGYKDQQIQKENNWKATGIIGLRDSKLKALPTSSIIAVGEGAKVLDATNNQIRELTGSTLCKLVNLQRLILANNQLAIVPSDVIEALVNLKFINLDNNQLSQLPAELGGLVKLEQLSVSSNRLLSLPDSLSGCVKLRRLTCKGNQLGWLPEKLPDEMEDIDASNNKLTAIPQGFSSLVKLTTLTLDSNQIPTVPPDVLLHCVALHTLSLHNNPITPDELQANTAFETFEQRRRAKYDKVIGGGAMLGPKGLDEGVDRKV